MEINLFENYFELAPAAATLEDVWRLVRTGEGGLRENTALYRSTGDKAYKQKCPAFAVAVLFRGGRSDRNARRLTGLTLVDVDHVDPTLVETYRGLANRDPHTLMSYVTVSGRGLRILCGYVPPADAAGGDAGTEGRTDGPAAPRGIDAAGRKHYDRVFRAANLYYSRLLGAATDMQCKNLGRLSGLSYDPLAFLNADARPFTPELVEACLSQAEADGRARTRQGKALARVARLFNDHVRREVEAQGAVYAPGHHNDYVMRAAYLLNDYGVDAEAAAQWAARQFADYREAAAVVRSVFRTRAAEHGCRRLPRDGGGGAHRGGGGGQPPVATPEDISRFLAARVDLRHNTVTNRTEFRPLTDGGAARQPWRNISDRDVNSLWAEMSREARVLPADIFRVIESDRVPLFDPFMDYLGRVAEASGGGAEGAIDRLAATVSVRGGGQEQSLWRDYLRKWLVGMVAAWADPDVVNNVILVLIGEQGTYKTTWFNTLLPPELRRYFYTKTNSSQMGRDDLLVLSQYGLVCCEELDTMRPAELNQLKAAVTMRYIDQRAAYAHFHEHRSHIASFCGTGNNVQFLSDPTGNRRWLPFEVERIDPPQQSALDYQAIYAEAWALYRGGFRYWFSREEIQQLSQHNQRYETPRPELELVNLYFRKPGPLEQGQFMPVSRIVQMIDSGASIRLNSVLVGRAMRELGFESVKTKGIRGYIVMPRTGAEIVEYQKLMAHQSGQMDR